MHSVPVYQPPEQVEQPDAVDGDAWKTVALILLLAVLAIAVLVAAVFVANRLIRNAARKKRMQRRANNRQRSR